MKSTGLPSNFGFGESYVRNKLSVTSLLERKFNFVFGVFWLKFMGMFSVFSIKTIFGSLGSYEIPKKFLFLKLKLSNGNTLNTGRGGGSGSIISSLSLNYLKSLGKYVIGP